ncbi:MAG: apolipoprotein N-acyltransferase [Granulosicoccus sp.]
MNTQPLAQAESAPVARRPFAVDAVLSLLAGLALPYAFAPTSWWPLAVLSIFIFYALLQQQTARRALLLGWIFGLGYFGIGVSWVYHSIHLFGAAVAPLAAAVTLLFVLVMTLFPAMTAWAWTRWHRPEHPFRNAWFFASLWLLAELARGKIMGGFPWILVGYSQTSAPLGDLAPLMGVYGIGFLVVAFAALIGCLIAGASPHPLATRLLALSCLIAIPAAAAISGRLSFSAPTGEAVAIRLVQANIPQEMKFSRERLESTLQQYTAMTREAGISDIDLVVWPETAIATYFDRVDNALQPFITELEKADIDVLSGGFSREGDNVYNSVRQLGGRQALYRKRHLVPFGEFMPFRFVLDFLARFIQIPMSDLAVGDGPYVPLDIQGAAIGVSICYEDVYGEEMRALLPASTLLINVSNDAWFGDTAAPHQHEQKARMRAREFARPLVRVTNTGVSSAIDERGRISGRIAHDTPGILDVSVMPRTGMTPYARTGNWPVFLVALAIVALVFFRAGKNRVVS